MLPRRKPHFYKQVAPSVAEDLGSSSLREMVMTQVELMLNGQSQRIEVDDPNTPLLWVLRDTLGMKGTKYGCGIGQCGACTVHLDGVAVRSCSVPISEAAKRTVTTIEGLSRDGSHPLQRAWTELDVPQCGYCQAGQIMNAAAFLKQNATPTDEQITAAMSGNLCRCGTYPRIHAAIKHSLTLKGKSNHG